MTIGLVIHLGYSENAELIAAIERAAADHGYLTLLADASRVRGHGESYRRLLLERRVDGLLMASGLGEDAFLRELRDHGVPLVVVNRRLRRRRAERQHGRRARDERRRRAPDRPRAPADRLHRRPPDVRHLAPPAGGLQGAMRAAHLRVAARYVQESSEHEVGGFEGDAGSCCARRPAPRAVAVWSVTIAVGALAAVRRAGLTSARRRLGHRVPRRADRRVPRAAAGDGADADDEDGERGRQVPVIALAEGKRVADTIVRRPAPRAWSRRGLDGRRLARPSDQSGSS